MTRPVKLILLLALVTGCRPATPPEPPLLSLTDGDGVVVWEEEYAFRPPPPPWELLELDEEDYSIAFFHGCMNSPPGFYPCESTFAYSEEPFGYSRDLEKRPKEFFRRFLWAARIDFDAPQRTPSRALGGEALQVETIGHERVLGHKVLVRAVFATRGERVVAFYFTQWRPEERPFDRKQLLHFERFVDSFSFRRPSFYQRLMAETEKAPR